MRKVNLAVIGCGLNARLNHLPALSRVPKARIVALCDLDLSRAEELKAQFELPECSTYQDYKQVLEREDIEAIVIATVPHVHAKICVDALKAGKHVYLEKPMATNLEDADAIVGATKSSEAMVMLGYNYRFEPHFQKVGELVKKGFVGQPTMIIVHLLGDARSGSSLTKFEFSKQQGGGILLEVGTHGIDHALWLAGNVTRVYSNVMATRFLDIPVEDIAILSLEHENGCVSIVDLSWHAPSLYGVQVFGGEGILNTTTSMDHVQGAKMGLVGQPWLSLPLAGSTFLSSHQRALNHFAECIISRTQPSIGVEDGLRNLKIILAAQESAASRAVAQVRT